MNMDPLINACATLVSVVLVPWGIFEYRRRTGVELTSQQRAAIDGAVNTATGLIETELDQGRLSPEQVTINNPVVRQQAVDALARVPDAAAAVQTSPETVTKMIVARVDTSPRSPAIATGRRV